MHLSQVRNIVDTTAGLKQVIGRSLACQECDQTGSRDEAELAKLSDFVHAAFRKLGRATSKLCKRIQAESEKR